MSMVMDIDSQAQETQNKTANVGNEDEKARPSRRRRRRGMRGKTPGKKKAEIPIDFSEIDKVIDFVSDLIKKQINLCGVNTMGVSSGRCR